MPNSSSYCLTLCNAIQPKSLFSKKWSITLRLTLFRTTAALRILKAVTAGTRKKDTGVCISRYMSPRMSQTHKYTCARPPWLDEGEFRVGEMSLPRTSPSISPGVVTRSSLELQVARLCTTRVQLR